MESNPTKIEIMIILDITYNLHFLYLVFGHFVNVEDKVEHITLYRKYRPKDFDEVAGEKEIITTIKNSLKENRIAHAYLFTGPRGVGKTTTARLIAKGLNCITNGITDNPCNVCENCLAIDKGNFIDLTEIDAASNRGIDEIRALKDKINYQPVRGRKKVYIIDEVHMLTKEAFNALLKTLEEPPSHVVFILATTEPDKILDTIISRCQRYDFTFFSLTEMSGKLREIAEAEGVEIDNDSLKLIYEKSGGSMRDGISVFEKIVSYYFGESINYEKTEKALGVIPKNKLLEFETIVYNNDIKEGMLFLDKLWEVGIDIEDFLRDFAYFIKNKLLTNSDISITKGIGIIEKIFEVINKFKYEEDKRLLGYLILYKIVEMPIETAQIRYVEKEVVRENIKQASAEEVNISIGINDIKNKWKEIRDKVSRKKLALKAFLYEAKVDKLVGNKLYLNFPKEFSYHKEMMEKRETTDILESTLKEFYGAEIKVVYELEGREEKTKEGNEDFLVEKVKEFFSGEIIR